MFYWSMSLLIPKPGFMECSNENKCRYAVSSVSVDDLSYSPASTEMPSGTQESDH